MLHLACRITDKLKSAFSEASWEWADKPSAEFLTKGGTCRIKTFNTDTYDFADVTVDSFARIGITMLQIKDVAVIATEMSENAETGFTVDVKAWYETRTQKFLYELITELNAKGTNQLEISEDGSVSIFKDGKSESQERLEQFPKKNLWNDVVKVLKEEAGLAAEERDDKIVISW